MVNSAMLTPKEIGEQPMNDRFSQGQRTWILGIAVNGGLAIIKLVAGIVGNSYALVADSVESLGDIFSSLIAWCGFAIGSRPADDNHPYGHGKAEPLAALAVAVMLCFAAMGIAWEAVHAMRTPHDAPAPYTLIVLIVTIVIKEAMFRFASRTGKDIDSSVILADAWHHRSDAITSLAAAVGITLTLLAGPAWITADEWAALLACLVIAGNGLRFVRHAIRELMDTAPPDAPLAEIRSSALTVQGARAIEKVLTRKVGPNWFVDLHLEVDGHVPVRDAHEIAHNVKDAIMHRLPAVADVLIHVEPYELPAS